MGETLAGVIGDCTSLGAATAATVLIGTVVYTVLEEPSGAAADWNA